MSQFREDSGVLVRYLDAAGDGLRIIWVQENNFTHVVIVREVGCSGAQ